MYMPDRQMTGQSSVPCSSSCKKGKTIQFIGWSKHEFSERILVRLKVSDSFELDSKIYFGVQ